MYLAACDVPFTESLGQVQCSGVLSQIDTSTLIPVFQISDIDMAVAGQLFAASFIFIGMLQVSVFALRFILDSVKGRF